MEPDREHGSTDWVTLWADTPLLRHERRAAASVWPAMGQESTLQPITVGMVIGYCWPLCWFMRLSEDGYGG